MPKYKTIYADPPWMERVSYAPRIELFARAQCPGWDVWGDEVDGIEIWGEGKICG